MPKCARLSAVISSVALVCTLAATPALSASIGTKILRGAAIGFAVDKMSGPLDKFINTVTLKHGMKSSLDTKVVPILSVGEKGYIGAAQVSGPTREIQRVKAVLQYEKNFSNNNYRAKILLPSASINPLKLERVNGVGVSAIIDVALDGRQRFNTVGTGIGTGDIIRGGAVLVAVKNVGPTINSALNTVTFNKGSVTKVVPMGSIGEKMYLGGAQVSASKTEIGKVSAVWQYEDLFDGGKFRVKILVPTTSSNPLKMRRVDGAGVTAVIDMALSQQEDLAAKRSANTRYRYDRDYSYDRYYYDNYRGRYNDDDDGERYEGRDSKKARKYWERERERLDKKYQRRYDNGKHKGWSKGKHKGRKHNWVDTNWQKKMVEVNPKYRDGFIDWLDDFENRDIKDFDYLFWRYIREYRD